MPETHAKLAENARKIKLAFVFLTLLFVFLLSSYGLLYHEKSQRVEQQLTDRKKFAQENRARINDIQKARVFSCVSTYEAIRQVFAPFFPDKPWSKEEKRVVHRFNSQINTLKKHCPRQVRSKR